MNQRLCISTKKRIDNDSGAVSFQCPKCNDYEIIRSTYARKNAIRYTCPRCSFSGPN